jgi:serine protease Do
MQKVQGIYQLVFRFALFLVVTAQGLSSNALADSLADIVEKVSPGVLSVHVRLKETKKAPGEPTALGTGFVVQKENRNSSTPGFSFFLVLTNYHVVEGAKKVELISTDMKVFSAAIVGTDRRNDIAVLRTELPSATPILRLKSSSTLRVGDPLFAIGNPYGLAHTVTNGILSAKDRSLGVGAIDRYLQTNVAINFGNSGGPLFDGTGWVVGITTLSKTESQGLGFAIPSDTVLKLLPRLAEGQKWLRPWMGVSVLPAHRSLIHFFETQEFQKKTAGVPLVVVEVRSGGPAHQIGIQKGDVILSLFQNEKEIPLVHPFQLRNLIESSQVGDVIEFRIQRQKQNYFKARLTLAQAPEEIEFDEFD